MPGVKPRSRCSAAAFIAAPTRWRCAGNLELTFSNSSRNSTIVASLRSRSVSLLSLALPSLGVELLLLRTS
jgi:hypothetical protein